MKRINIADLTNWHLGKKTKPIRVKPLINILIDKVVTNEFLLKTLEGTQELDHNSLVCIGETSECWQQKSTDFLNKYDVKEWDNDGWIIGVPKDGEASTVKCTEITFKETDGDPDIYIIAGWGKATDEGPAQYGHVGDFICQHRSNPEDNWIVARNTFLNTYSILS